MTSFILSFFLLKFIPVRGRKLFEFSQIIEHDVEIYPREGTETGWPSHQFVLEHELKFIPVRGRKRVARSAVLMLVKLKFIPVRGRKRALPELVEPLPS